MRVLIRWSVLIAFLGSGLALAQPALHLKTRRIPTGPAGATTAEASSPRPFGRGHALIQFQQPPSADTVAELERRGARVLADIPENGLLVSLDRRVRLDDLGARYAAPIHPSDKISPLIARRDPAAASGYYLVEFHSDVDMNQARGLVLNLGLPLEENPDLGSRRLMIHVPPDERSRTLARLTAQDEVAYVFPASSELANGIPVRACEGALTTNGPATQSVPTYGDGWDGPGLGAATISYVFSRMTTQLDPASAQSEIRRAMAQWSSVAKIAWQAGFSASGPRTVNILWATGEHGDGYAFDGPGGILAHTFYPAPPNPEPIAGDMHFDDSEGWRIGSNTDLFSVALHELGHALGLGHSDNPNDVMYPYYKLVTTLAAGDRAAVLSLYAAQDGTIPPTSPSTPTTPTTPTTPLTLTVNVPPSATAASAINLTGSATGGSGTIAVTWSTSGGASGTASGAASAWTIPSVPLAVGANTITVTATSGGNQVSRSVTVTRQSTAPTAPTNPADTTPPTLAITSPSSAVVSTALSAITIRGTARDNVGVKMVAWSSNANLSGTAAGTAIWSARVPLLIGYNTITIRAYDAAGNSAWRTIVVARH